MVNMKVKFINKISRRMICWDRYSILLSAAKEFNDVNNLSYWFYHFINKFFYDRFKSKLYHIKTIFIQSV